MGCGGKDEGEPLLRSSTDCSRGLLFSGPGAPLSVLSMSYLRGGGGVGGHYMGYLGERLGKGKGRQICRKPGVRRRRHCARHSRETGNGRTEESWGRSLSYCRRKFWGESAKSLWKEATVTPTPWKSSRWVRDLQAVPESPGAGTHAGTLRTPPAPCTRWVGLTRTRLNLSSSSPASGIGCLAAAGCLGDGAAGPAGCSALPAALPMVAPTQSARRLQPRKSSFPGVRGRGSRPEGRGGQRLAAAEGLGDTGARLSGVQGPGRGVPSGRPRPRSRAASCGVGGGSQAAGRRGQRAGPGAGSCGAVSPLGDFLTSAVAPGARKPHFAAAAATHPAPGGRAGGRGRAPGAGRGSAAAMARRGRGCRPGSPPPRGARRRYTCRSGRRPRRGRGGCVRGGASGS